MKINRASAYALHALMYMVRHVTQLPATGKAIAKAEGIPEGYLAKVLQQLVKGGFLRSVKGRERGYVFARPPEEISLLEVFEAIEGKPLFDDCPLRHCDCGGTRQTCRIFYQWTAATRKFRDLLDETTIANAAWNHPEHRFNSLPSLTITEETG
jgi:Rrf2 family protein